MQAKRELAAGIGRVYDPTHEVLLLGGRQTCLGVLAGLEPKALRAMPTAAAAELATFEEATPLYYGLG